MARPIARRRPRPASVAAALMDMISQSVPDRDMTRAAADNTDAATAPRFTSRNGAVGPAGMLPRPFDPISWASESGERIPVIARSFKAMAAAAISVKPKMVIEIASANADHVLSVSNYSSPA